MTVYTRLKCDWGRDGGCDEEFPHYPEGDEKTEVPSEWGYLQVPSENVTYHFCPKHSFAAMGILVGDDDAP